MQERGSRRKAWNVLPYRTAVPLLGKIAMALAWISAHLASSHYICANWLWKIAQRLIFIQYHQVQWITINDHQFWATSECEFSVNIRRTSKKQMALRQVLTVFINFHQFSSTFNFNRFHQKPMKPEKLTNGWVFASASENIAVWSSFGLQPRKVSHWVLQVNPKP